MRLRATSALQRFVLLFVMTSCAPPEAPRAAPPSPPIAAARGASASAPDCADFVVEKSSEAPHAAAIAGPRADLGSLFASTAASRAPHLARAAASVVDLGTVVVAAGAPRPRAAIDLGRRAVPPSASAPLPEALRSAWEARTDARASLRATLIAELEARTRMEACSHAPCARAACYGVAMAAAEAEAARIGARIKALEADLVARLEPLAGQSASPGVLLALAVLLDERARHGDFSEPGHALAPAVALYERIRAAVDESTEVGWFARYALAVARIDAGEDALARAALEELAAAPARPDGGTVEALYRLGEMISNPAQAAGAFHRAAELAKTAAPSDSPLRGVALERWMEAELAANHPKAAIVAGAALLDETSGGDIDLSAEVVQTLGPALDALDVADRAGLPSVPIVHFAPIAMAVADAALARLDFAAAEHAFAAIASRAPNSIEAPLALATRVGLRRRSGDGVAADALRGELARYRVDSPWADGLRAGRTRDGRPTNAEITRAAAAQAPDLPAAPNTPDTLVEELRQRTRALLADCADKDGDIPEEVTFDLEILRTGGVRVRARGSAIAKDASLLFACIAARGPRYFVDTTVGARARLTPNP